jgi:hypothetical protein
VLKVLRYKSEGRWFDSTATTDSPDFDFGAAGLLSYSDSPPPLPSRLHEFPQTGSLESTFQEGIDPEHRQVSGTALTISNTEPNR